MKILLIVVGSILTLALVVGTTIVVYKASVTTTSNAVDEPPTPEPTSIEQVPLRPVMPTSSGRAYHAMDLLIRRPFPDQGRLVTLDVVAEANTDYGQVMAYTTVPGYVPDEANARGLQFTQMLDEEICIYSVIAYVPEVDHSGPQSVGQIAVQIEPGTKAPSISKIWDVEPEGIEQVTTNDGTMKQIPKIRFWRYH